MIYPTATMTWKERERALRLALAHLPVTTARELILRMGGSPQAIDQKQLRIAEWDLRTHGYSREEIDPGDDALPIVKYVRRCHWKEDNWPICPCCGGSLAY